MADYKEPQSIIDVAKNAIEKSKAFMAESEKRTQCFDNFIDLLASNRVLYNKYNAINKFAKTNTTGIDVDDRINAYLLQEAGGIVNEKNVESAFELVKTECYQKIAERKQEQIAERKQDCSKTLDSRKEENSNQQNYGTSILDTLKTVISPLDKQPDSSQLQNQKQTATQIKHTNAKQGGERKAPTIYQDNTVLDPLSKRSGVLRNKS